MRKSSLYILAFLAFFLIALGILVGISNRYDEWSKVRLTSYHISQNGESAPRHFTNWQLPDESTVYPIENFLTEGVDWLANSQAADGGWGAGQHTAQHVQDPHAVATDPATTAMAAMALLRAGHTLNQGQWQAVQQRATNYLLTAAEQVEADNFTITDQRGTQPQRKLGEQVDVALAAQFFARLLPYLSEDRETKRRTFAALERCILLLESAQQTDGSWNNRGWAPVLHSAMVNTALELAQRVGITIDNEVLRRSQQYQQQNVYADGSIRTESAAGIPLYALSSTQRATAGVANTTRQALATEFDQQQDTLSKEMAIDALVRQGVSEEEASDMAQTYVTNVVAARQVMTDDVQRGFGNNGGEEFLSHMLTSESLAALGGDNWTEWHERASELYRNIQNGNASWSGHHCITSPVFCTAAVVMTLTADREPPALMARNG